MPVRSENARIGVKQVKCRLDVAGIGSLILTHGNGTRSFFSPWLRCVRSVSCQVPASSGLDSARPDEFALGRHLCESGAIHSGAASGDGKVAMAGPRLLGVQR